MENISFKEIEELLSNIETYSLGIKLLEKLDYNFTNFKIIYTTSGRPVLKFRWKKQTHQNYGFLFNCGIRIYDAFGNNRSCYKDLFLNR